MSKRAAITLISLIISILVVPNSACSEQLDAVCVGGIAECATLEMTEPVDRNIDRKVDSDMEGEIQISGAFALYPFVVRMAEEFNKIYPNIRIDISAGGAGKGITDALTSMVDLGMVSREIHPAELEKGAFPIVVARDAVLASFNIKNPVVRDVLFHGISQQRATKLWSNQSIKTWGELIGTNSKIPVHPYTRSDACGAAETWAAWLGLHQENLEGTAVFGDPGVASVVQNDKVAIGFNNLAYVYDINTRLPYKNIAVVPIDINNNSKIDPQENFYAHADMLLDAIFKGKYPTPPARDLYLVLKGEPTKKEVKIFLEFVLTEGQQYAIESLFIPLTAEQQGNELLKLNLD